MKYEKLIRDFAERTGKNLVAIEKLTATQAHEKKGLDDYKVFETTQLINSCLGLIALPFEKGLKEIHTTSLEELQAKGWPIPKLINQTEKWRKLTLRQLIEYLRNAILHFNIKFTHDEKDQINGLKLWNEKKKVGKIWESTISEDELRSFVKKFSDEIVQNLPE